MRKKVEERSTPLIAVIYARYSSHNQREVSIEQQIEECQAYADAHGLRVKGDSMTPVYLDGDVLIVRIQDNADTGDDAVVFINGDDATFKRVSVTPAGISLRPLNPSYEPLFFTNTDVAGLPIRILGVAVEVRRRVRR